MPVSSSPPASCRVSAVPFSRRSRSRSSPRSFRASAWAPRSASGARSQAQPLVPLRLFNHRNYTLMNGTSLAVAFAMQGIFPPFTIYLQSVRGMSALDAGLAVAPLSLVSMFVAPFSGRLADRFGGKYFLMAGLVLFATGTGALFVFASLDSTWQTFVAPLKLDALRL